MQLNITARHDSKVSQAVREHIASRVGRSDGYFDAVTRMQVTVDKEADSYMVEACFHITGKELFAKATSDNLYVAIDETADKVERQLIKALDKKAIKKGAGIKHLAPEVLESELTDLEVKEVAAS